MPDDVLRVGASFDVTPVTAGITLAADAVETGTARMNTSFSRVGPAWEEATHKMAFSTREAQHALRGFGEEIGVKMPRFVSSFVADLGGVGPALAAAFTPVAIIGLAVVLAEAAEKAYNFYENIVNLKSAFEALETVEKSFTETQIGLSNALLEGQTRLAGIAGGPAAESKAHIEQLGSSIEDLGKMLDSSGKQFNDLSLAARSSLREFLVPTQAKDFQTVLHDVGLEIKRVQSLLLNTDEDTTDYKNLSVAVQGLSSFYNTLALKVQQYNQEVGIVGAEANARAIEAAEKYQQFLEQTFSTETKLTQEGAAKELAAMERVRAERERSEEEIARAADESYKKDLESFQRSATGKTKLIEEQGKNELEQIRANVAMQEKVTASTSARGAGDPHISTEALAGYQQEVKLIQQMIVEEEKLKAVLAAGGADEDDPKMLESMAREQQMIQQLQVAWQKYAQTVENVNANQYKAFEKALTSMTQSFNQNFVQWANGSQTFGRAMQHVWTSVADTAISSGLKVAEQMVANFALHKALMAGTKYDTAADAARNTYASVSAIPIIGPFLAPEAAAVAFAAVMAFEKGGIVPRTDIAQLHKGEMVLPAHISQSVQKMAESGQGGGGHTFNYNPTVHGSSASGIKDMLEQHGKQFVDHAIREMRRRNVG